MKATQKYCGHKFSQLKALKPKTKKVITNILPIIEFCQKNGIKPQNNTGSMSLKSKAKRKRKTKKAPFDLLIFNNGKKAK